MSEQPQIGPDDWHKLDPSTMHEALRPRAIELMGEHGYEITSNETEAADQDTIRIPQYDPDTEPATALLQTMQKAEIDQPATIESLSEYNFDDLLAEGAYTPQQFGHFTTALHQLTLKSIEEGEPNPYAPPPAYQAALDVLSNAPDEMLQMVYFDPRAPGSLSLREMIRANIDTYEFHPQGRNLLLRLHDKDDLIALKTDEGIHHDDPNVQDLLEHPDFNKIVIDELWEDHAELVKGEADEANRQVRSRQYRYLHQIVGLTPDHATDLQYASLARTSNKNDLAGNYDFGAISEQLHIMNAHRQQTGPEAMQWLYERHGLINQDAYPVDLLHRMSKALQGDETQLKYLRSGDVTVVLRDAVGDYNNATGQDGRLFDTADKRMLMFEINRATDLYRPFATLKQLGVLPSTVVISSHGTEGGVLFGQKNRDGFALHNQHPKMKGLESHHLSVLAAKGFRRLVREYMQPLRFAADSKDRGRQRIILASCHSDTEWSVGRPLPGNPNNIRQESIAHTLVSASRHQGLDVYGGEGVIGFRNVDGRLLYLDASDEQNPVPITASKLRRDKLGRIVRSRHEYVDLNGETNDA